MTRIVSLLDAAGHFAGEAIADDDQLNPGFPLLPIGAVDVAPPVVQPGMRYWHDGNGEWIEEPIPAPEPDPTPEPPSLEQLRIGALSRLPAWEATERAAGIAHAGRDWLTTPAALQDVRDALLAGMVPGGQWIDATRAPVPMDLAGLQSLWQAMVARGAEIYARRIEMESAIALMTRDELEAFEPGWPAP